MNFNEDKKIGMRIDLSESSLKAYGSAGSFEMDVSDGADKDLLKINNKQENLVKVKELKNKKETQQTTNEKILSKDEKIIENKEEK